MDISFQYLPYIFNYIQIWDYEGQSDKRHIICWSRNFIVDFEVRQDAPFCIKIDSLLYMPRSPSFIPLNWDAVDISQHSRAIFFYQPPDHKWKRMPNRLTSIYLVKPLTKRMSYKFATSTKHFYFTFIGKKYILPFINTM